MSAVGRKIEDVYPLSPLQQGLLFESLPDSSEGAYIVQIDSSVRGRLDVAVLKRAWEQLVARHAVLRTGFLWERQAVPLQVVHRKVDLAFQERDLRSIPEAEREESVRSLIDS